LNMEGDWNGAQGKNKYQYNGKELNDDFGLGWNHHDWRFYDVAIGRFVTVDRLAEEEDQEQLSPYHFSYNNPIRYDDPDGQCPTCITAAGMALLEGGIELAGQLLENGGDFRKVDWVDVGVEAIKGAATGSGAGLFARGALEVTGEVVKAGVDGSIEGGLETVVTKDEQGKRTKTLSEAGIDLAVGVVGGKLGDKAVDKGISALQKGASKAKDVASAKTQAAKFATDRAKELKQGGESARSAAAAKGAKMTSRDAKNAQMNSSVKKTVANKAKTPLRVVSGAAQNRVSNVVKDKTDAANRR
jgi:RHS repeat-associated protein